MTHKQVVDGQKKKLISESDLGRFGFQKPRFCQQRAAQDGLRYFWIGTCCVNKQNSDQLSYALLLTGKMALSMFSEEENFSCEFVPSGCL